VCIQEVLGWEPSGYKGGWWVTVPASLGPPLDILWRKPGMRVSPACLRLWPPATILGISRLPGQTCTRGLQPSADIDLGQRLSIDNANASRELQIQLADILGAGHLHLACPAARPRRVLHRCDFHTGGVPFHPSVSCCCIAGHILLPAYRPHNEAQKKLLAEADSSSLEALRSVSLQLAYSCLQR
jgi:hypothetical protein